MRTIFMILAAVVLARSLPFGAFAAYGEGPDPTDPAGNPGTACEKPSAAWNTRTPPELYGGMVSCIEGNDYDSAVFFFAVAGAYTYYDTLRVTDGSARSAQTGLLQKAVADLDRTKRDTLMDAIQRHLGNADLLPEICAEVARVGAPKYDPAYILRGGTAAAPGNLAEGDLVRGFDSRNGWKNAMNGYLHCPSFEK